MLIHEASQALFIRFGPRRVIDCRVEPREPTLATLLRTLRRVDLLGELGGHVVPIGETVFLDGREHLLVFFAGPISRASLLSSSQGHISSA